MTIDMRSMLKYKDLKTGRYIYKHTKWHEQIRCYRDRSDWKWWSV